ncbi:DNA methyltransferase [Capnocytophaga stomatis]|uniref:DNA methyltransferase n=1 Tax=Capnocytophaga stomatis TaxID=1848904 RepID=UPI00385F7C9E
MNNYDRLQEVLKELFEMDKADLDFGIYRIMNQKREQVTYFIDRKLPQDIREILAQTQSKDSLSIQAALDKAIKSAEVLGIDPDTLPKVVELKAQLQNTVDTHALEQEVFSHLANFFKRYYKDGDFISLRRYKKDVYAIPYEGEEVKLHWANHDQYYIKTSEYLKNYTFRLKDGKQVHFLLKEASTEQNNNKTTPDKERRFAIYKPQPLEVLEGELYIYFTYEPHEKSVKQADLQTEAFQIIQASVLALSEAQNFSAVFYKAPTEKNKDRTLLEKHLNNFISRNSFDYFIHKDLGGFLRRELDFYIKNEVLYLDDINTENPAFFTTQLSKIKALKTVATKIIDFLAQIEDFQKKLWLKKKFVISTHYCITLDRVPEKYYADIVANTAQLAEWQKLFGVAITAEQQLKDEPYLVLDTQYFSETFKDRLLGEFDNLDEETNGVLINSENFQALNLLQEKYREKVKTIYIDPPYNTGNDGFTYKDGFQSSSWASLVHNRLATAKPLLDQAGVIFQSIDDNEQARLKLLSDNVFGEENFVAELPTIMNLKGNQDQFGFAGTHEYTLVYAKSYVDVSLNGLSIDEEEIEFEWSEDKIGYYKQGAGLISTGTNSPREHRPRLWYPIFIKDEDSIYVPPKEDLDKFYDAETKQFNDDYLYQYIEEKVKAGVGEQIKYENILMKLLFLKLIMDILCIKNNALILEICLQGSLKLFFISLNIQVEMVLMK